MIALDVHAEDGAGRVEVGVADAGEHVPHRQLEPIDHRRRGGVEREHGAAGAHECVERGKELVRSTAGARGFLPTTAAAATTTTRRTTGAAGATTAAASAARRSF